MWLCGSLVITILLTVGSNTGQACQVNEQTSAMLSAINDLSLAFARMNETMSVLLSSMNQSIAVMSSTMNELSSAFARINRLSGMSGSSEESNMGVESTDTAEDADSDKWPELDTQHMSTLLTQPENVYRITRVSKRDMGDYNQITVEYAPNDTRPELLTDIKSSNVVYGGDLDPPEEGKITVDIFSKYRVNLYITFPHGFRLTLDLDLVTFVNDIEEMDVPRILVSVSPQDGDVVYEPGTQPRLELTLWTQDLDDVAVAGVEIKKLLTLRTDEDTMTRFSSEHIDPNEKHQIDWQVLDVVERPGYYHWKYAINSSFHDPEGFLRLVPKLHFNCSSSKCLVREFETLAPPMSLRRTDHVTPFPENYFGFVAYVGWDVDFDSGAVYCNAESECGLLCLVSWGDKNKNGSSISVEINQVMPDGDVVATDDSSGWRKAKSWSMLIFEHATPADSGRVFRCSARSGQREISKDFELFVTQPPRFIRELTNVTRFNNGSVAATCVAEGFPRPFVMVEVFEEGNPTPPPAEVTMTELNETTAMASTLVTDNNTYFWCAARQNTSMPYSDNYLDPEQ